MKILPVMALSLALYYPSIIKDRAVEAKIYPIHHIVNGKKQKKKKEIYTVTAPWSKVYKPLTPLITKAAKTTNLNPKLIVSIIHTESHGKLVRSSKGAIGVMQVKPIIGRITKTNIYNTKGNITAGAKYLKTLINHYNGNIKLALEAYNCGPTKTDIGNVPPISVKYAQTIIAFMNSLS